MNSVTFEPALRAPPDVGPLGADDSVGVGEAPPSDARLMSSDATLVSKERGIAHS